MAMSRDEIYDEVKEVLVDALGLDDDEVTESATLMGDLGAESIDFLDIVFRLEKSFGIKIPREELFPGESLMNNPEYVSNGKLTAKGIAELKAKMREFAGDLAACSDKTELIAMLASYQVVTDQCQRDLPDWWSGDGRGVEGAGERIEERRRELADTEPVYDGKPEASTLTSGTGAVQIEVPTQPDLIPVPAPSNDSDMKIVWQTWCKAFLAAIDACEDVSAVNAWMKANTDPLKNLNVSSTAAYQHIETIVKAKRGTLAQAPATEAAE